MQHLKYKYVTIESRKFNVAIDISLYLQGKGSYENQLEMLSYCGSSIGELLCRKF